MRLSVVMLALCSVCVACGGDDGEAGSGGSCNLITSDGYCVQYTGSGIAFKEGSEICGYEGGNHGSSPCPTSDLIGTCTRHDGTNNERVWFFYTNHYLESTAKGHCMNLGGTWTLSGSPGRTEDDISTDIMEDMGIVDTNDTVAHPLDTTVTETITNGCQSDFPDKHDDTCWSENKGFQDRASAVTFCTSIGGRLPTIDELRTLVQNCPATETGGTCGVTSSCLDKDPCSDESCAGCVEDKTGTYSVFGDVSGMSSYWGSSSMSTPGNYWVIDFREASIVVKNHATAISARCLK